MCKCTDPLFANIAGDIVCTKCGEIFDTCFPQHDRNTYVIEESTDIISRNYFVARYLEIKTHEKLYA